MSMSSNEMAGQELSLPVTSFAYRDMGSPSAQDLKASADAEGDPAAAKVFTEKQVKELLHEARVQAASEAEIRVRTAYELKSAEEAAGIRKALEGFQVERRDYFSRVEVEVIQLVLAIAAKILHREAQVDPMLVAALVRVAIDKLHDGSSVSVRVAPSEAGKWRTWLANPINGAAIEIVEDAHLGPADCILETELGSANFSIEAQMKEVERGFFDLLAQRPDNK